MWPGKLQSQYPKPLIVKETGLPSGPASTGFTEVHQSAFWAEILKQSAPSETRAVSCFEAFDAPWKPAVTRGYFPGVIITGSVLGIFTVGWKPKPVVKAIRLIRGETVKHQSSDRPIRIFSGGFLRFQHRICKILNPVSGIAVDFTVPGNASPDNGYGKNNNIWPFLSTCLWPPGGTHSARFPAT